MDLETENRIAAILMKEASDMRRQAENEGSLAYLRQPTPRSKPNSRFLTATVLGVQQANRAVEVNELWRLREKQVELETRLEGRRNRGRGSSGNVYKDVCESRSNSGRRKAEPSESDSHASKKRDIDDLRSSDEGLGDEDMEEFLNARRKRGRGAVGSRVEETGPYLPHSPGSTNVDEVSRSSRAPLGPAKPSYLKSSESSDDESRKSDKKMSKVKSSKKHSKRHKSERKSKEDAKKKKRREEDKKKRKRKHRD